MRLTATALLCLAITSSAFADGLAVAPADTTASVIAAQKGKRITLRLRSGEEITGLVRNASDRLVVLGQVSGRELFDAAVPVDAVEAVLVRVQTQ